jgi:hypothetical protein
MVNPEELTLEQKIKALEEWVNLINGRIDNNSVPQEVRLDIRDQHNFDDLRANIRDWSRAYEQNTQIIDANERIDNDAPEHERQAAVAAARTELENIENLIVLFNQAHVDEIEQILNRYIHGGRRRVRKRGQESRRRSSSSRKSSAKKRASRRKPRSAKKRASRRYRHRRA